jgi:hypothetical protein
VDFIKKGHQWTIWHLHWSRTVKAFHYPGWVKEQLWLFPGPLGKSVKVAVTLRGGPSVTFHHTRPWSTSITTVAVMSFHRESYGQLNP